LVSFELLQGFAFTNFFFFHSDSFYKSFDVDDYGDDESGLESENEEQG